MSKRLTLIVLLLCTMVSLTYADAHRGMKLNSAKEDGTNAVVDNRSIVPFVPYVLSDTSGAVPTLRNYYDYATNGNNLRGLWVLGDTVIIATDMTDSLNAGTSTARNSYYQCSFDKGITWLPAALQVNPTGNAYPDVSPVILSGSRTVAIQGRQFVAGARTGYTGVDVVLGAGSITTTLVNGQEIFGQQMDATHLACGFESKTTDSLYFAKFDFTTNTYSNKTLLAVAADGILANTRSYTCATMDGKIAMYWWDGTAGDMWYRLSTDFGATWGAKVHTFSAGQNVNGDLLEPWLAADVIYGPTGNLCLAESTLEQGAFGTVRGSKLCFVSPTVNSGNPVVVVDYHNPPSNSMLVDTNYYNNHYSSATQQVGMTAFSHPSLAYSSDGSYLFVVYSVVQKDTASYGYFYNDICESYSTNNGATWSAPVILTNTTTADEIYPSISKTGNSSSVICVTYELSECPGSHSFTNTATPICPVYHVYKRFNPITGAQVPIGVENISSQVPKSYSLNQNFPNPFNPTTKIRFAMPKSGNVTLQVYNTIGQVVATLVNNEHVEAGLNEVTFDGANYSSGVYFYTLKTSEFTETKKMVLVK